MMMRTIFHRTFVVVAISVAAIICTISACKNATTNNHDTYAGEYPFEQRELVFSANPAKALEDTTISLKVTCYPKFTGTGWMAISLGSTSQFLTVLEFPYRDTLRDYTEIRVHTKFQAGNPFTQEWKFRLLFKPDDYAIAAIAGYDSIFIPVGYNETFAELAPNIKNKISHRYNAIIGFTEWLKSL